MTFRDFRGGAWTINIDKLAPLGACLCETEIHNQHEARREQESAHDDRGYSERNLRNMKRFAEEYPHFLILQVSLATLALNGEGGNALKIRLRLFLEDIIDLAEGIDTARGAVCGCAPWGVYGNTL